MDYVDMFWEGCNAEHVCLSSRWRCMKCWDASFLHLTAFGVVETRAHVFDLEKRCVIPLGTALKLCLLCCALHS